MGLVPDALQIPHHFLPRSDGPLEELILLPFTLDGSTSKVNKVPM